MGLSRRGKNQVFGGGFGNWEKRALPGAI